MLQQPTVRKWTIAVSAKKKTDANKRAGWIWQHLESRGVPSDRIEVVTSEGDEQVGFLVTERAEGPAAEVCPAGSEVTPRAPSEAPPPAPASVPSSPAPTPAPAAPAGQQTLE